MICDVISMFWGLSRTSLIFLLSYIDVTIFCFDSKYLLDMIQMQAFVSEYAVWRGDAGRGSLLASLAEAAFLTGLEKNR